MLIKYLLLVLILTYNLFPQIQKEEIYSIISSDDKNTEIRQVSTTGLVIIIKTENNMQNYYLVDLFNKQEEKLLFSSQNPQREAIRFSENNRFITFSTKETERYVMKIYDTLEDTIIEINDPQGDVVYASVVGKNILYEVRPPREYPKIYMIAQGSDRPKYITDGMTPKWSPDGKWFLALKAEYAIMDTAKKIVKKLGYIITKKPIYSIYNSNGKRILDIKNHENINLIEWSPTSDKIAFKKLGGVGFYLIYLKISFDKIELENVYHVKGFAKEGANFAYMENLKWSPDGNWISFLKSVENGHSVIECAIYIHNAISHRQVEIIKLPHNKILEIDWISNYEILTTQGNDVNKISIPLLKNKLD